MIFSAGFALPATWKQYRQKQAQTSSRPIGVSAKAVEPGRRFRHNQTWQVAANLLSIPFQQGFADIFDFQIRPYEPNHVDVTPCQNEEYPYFPGRVLPWQIV
jgi:hypothetical protein